MGQIIAVANQKGGVGKTTTAINLGAFLTSFDKLVLIVDIDPQGNASSGVGLNTEKVEVTLYDVLMNDENIKDAIHPTSIKNLHILPANADLAGAAVELIEEEDREYKVKEILAPIRDLYDYILLDCPPSLGILTINALTAADKVLVPVQCEYYAMEGLSRLMRTLELIKEQLNENLKIQGIVLTMYDPRTSLNKEVVSETKIHFKNRVFRTIIPRNIRISEAPSYGQPISIYAENSAGAKAYKELAKEVVKHG